MQLDLLVLLAHHASADGAIGFPIRSVCGPIELHRESRERLAPRKRRPDSNARNSLDDELIREGVGVREQSTQRARRQGLRSRVPEFGKLDREMHGCHRDRAKPVLFHELQEA